MESGIIVVLMIDMIACLSIINNCSFSMRCAVSIMMQAPLNGASCESRPYRGAYRAYNMYVCIEGCTAQTCPLALLTINL
jgi:hypothetical protein